MASHYIIRLQNCRSRCRRLFGSVGEPLAAPAIYGSFLWAQLPIHRSSPLADHLRPRNPPNTPFCSTSRSVQSSNRTHSTLHCLPEQTCIKCVGVRPGRTSLSACPQLIGGAHEGIHVDKLRFLRLRYKRRARGARLVGWCAGLCMRKRLWLPIPNDSDRGR